MAVNTEKIKLNKFGIRKTVNIRATFGLLEKLDELDVTLLELQDTEGMDYIDVRKNGLKSVRLKMAFVQSAFELKDEEVETIKNNVDPEQFGEAFEYVTLRMRGVTDENYNVLVVLKLSANKKNSKLRIQTQKKIWSNKKASIRQEKPTGGIAIL